jgi:hypothetical protein
MNTEEKEYTKSVQGNYARKKRVSSSEEIACVFLEDIARKNMIVRNKYGLVPFLSGCAGFSVHKIISYPRGDGNSVIDFSVKKEN